MVKVNIYGQTKLIDEEAAKKDLLEVMKKYNIVSIEAYLGSNITYIKNERGENSAKGEKTKTNNR